MKVGQRLFLAVIPAVLGVFSVVALLAYFGQYAHAAPEALIVIAIIAAVARWWSRGATRGTWRSASSSSPARRAESPAHADELDDIEHGVREAREFAEQRTRDLRRGC